MAKDTFVFFREWRTIIGTLPDASRLKFYDMLSSYEGGELPVSGDPHLDGVVSFVFTKVAENNKKYQEKCDKAAISAKMRWDANACERIDSHKDAMPNNANVKNALHDDNDTVYDNDITTPKPPSSPVGKEVLKKRSRKLGKEETTKEQAISHYKTETEMAMSIAPAEAEKYRDLGREICGMKTTECPNGMVKTIMRLPEQLDFAQYQSLCKKMGGHDTVRSILLEMHNNYEQYLTKRQSVNLVAQDWYKNRLKRDGGGNGHSTEPKKGLSIPQKVSQ